MIASPSRCVLVSELLDTRFQVQAKAGSKSICPFCGHKTFSIKSDDSLGKCFHPDCGKYIVAGTGVQSDSSSAQPFLVQLFNDFHQALMRQAPSTTRGAYRYLTVERQIHPQVIADSMLGAVPDNLDFNRMVARTGNLRSVEDGPESEFKEKLEKCLAGAGGWLCFFYTDQYHRIVSIRFRQPYSKHIRYFKPFKDAGLFGHGLFRPDSQERPKGMSDVLIVTEGEFNQLQLQSLVLRQNEAAGHTFGYVPACAVGGVHNADLECIKAVCRTPLVCYDNDASNAGFQLVETAAQQMSVRSFTTPGKDSDLDSWIRSYETNYVDCWEALKALIKGKVLHPRSPETVARQIFQVRRKRGGKDMRRDFEITAEVARIIIDDMRDRGRFYSNGREGYYFDDVTKRLSPLGPENQEACRLLFNYGVISTEPLYRHIIERLRMTAIEEGQRTIVHRLAHHDIKTNTHYLTNFNDEIIRTTVEGYDVVPNGEDGVLFVSDSQSETIELIENTPGNSKLDEIIISRINFAPDTLTADERRVIFTIWLMAILFPDLHPTKPIMAFIGEKGSGKSLTLRMVGTMLFGRCFNVSPLPTKEEDFDTMVTNSVFVAIDNADSRCRWLPDKMAVVATGGKLQKRKLYTTNSVSEIPLNCFLAITARTPRFNRDDVADRTLTLKVGRLPEGKFLPERELIREVLTNRTVLMTELVHCIQDVLKAISQSGGKMETVQFRMADFASFAMIIGKAAGIEAQIESIFKKLMTEQSAFTLEGDPIYELLAQWVAQNEGKEVTSSDLCGELSTIADRQGLKFYYKGKERSFAAKLTHLKPNLKEFFKIEETVGKAGKRLYSLSSKQDREVTE